MPFELLEPHTGPRLSWDDVLDFKLALDGGADGAAARIEQRRDLPT